MDKGVTVAIYGKFYIYKHSKMDKCLNEQHSITSDLLFDLLCKQNMDREGWYH
jgi:hypothetical protein